MAAVFEENEVMPSLKKLADAGQRSRLSEYLPYIAQDQDTAAFYLYDGEEKKEPTYNVGYMWECTPLTFADDKSLSSLTQIFRQPFPDRTVVQFILYPDDHIDPMLKHYALLKTRKDELSALAAQHYADYLKGATGGLKNMAGIPVRNFRLFCTVKSPHNTGLPEDMLAKFEEDLKQIGLRPMRVKAPWFLEFMRRLINRRTPTTPGTYFEEKELRDQIIESGTVIRVHEDCLQIGHQWAACITPKSLPTDGFVRPLDMNRVCGGFMGAVDDAKQINHRFLWTTTVFYQATPATIRRKIGVMSAQRVGGSLAKALGRRNAEGDQVIKELETHPYCNVLTSMWIFADDKEELDQATARAMSLWEDQKFMMQRDSRIVVPLFITALPFGTYLKGNNQKVMQRNFEVNIHAAAHLCPIQADFGGHMTPILPFVGRKGQLITVDVFAEGANNHNFLICASSGAGKSFTTNFIVQNYYAAGAKIRITDIGYSYRKQCMLAKGRYIDIGEEADRLCVNPFASLGADAEDAAGDKLMTASIILTMSYSATDTNTLSETHWSLMKDAVDYALAQDGGEKGIDHVYAFLKNYPNLGNTESWEGAKEIAHEIAFNLRDFTTWGKYGRIFNGKSTLDMRDDDFVVLELERIFNNKELFKVIAMQVINSITMDLYLSNRRDKRFMLFDEAWKYFGEAPMIAKIIQEGYRRARKYHGATGIVTQSPLDLKGFGAAGVVVRSNSAYKFFLESEDYPRAVREGVLDYDGMMLQLASSVTNKRPRYSEIFMDTPLGAGVARLNVDRWTYWMNTSSGGEVAKFEDCLRGGMSALQAINHLAKQS